MSTESEPKAIDDYYAILEVSRDASFEEIKKYYRRLIRKTHPDKVGKAGEELSKKLNEAYSVLSNSSDRNHYDHKLRNYEMWVEENREFQRRRAERKARVESQQAQKSSGQGFDGPTVSYDPNSTYSPTPPPPTNPPRRSKGLVVVFTVLTGIILGCCLLTNTIVTTLDRNFKNPPPRSTETVFEGGSSTVVGETKDVNQRIEQAQATPKDASNELDHFLSSDYKTQKQKGKVIIAAAKSDQGFFLDETYGYQPATPWLRGKKDAERFRARYSETHSPEFREDSQYKENCRLISEALANSGKISYTAEFLLQPTTVSSFPEVEYSLNSEGELSGTYKVYEEGEDSKALIGQGKIYGIFLKKGKCSFNTTSSSFDGDETVDGDADFYYLSKLAIQPMQFSNNYKKWLEKHRRSWKEAGYQ